MANRLSTSSENQVNGHRYHKRAEGNISFSALEEDLEAVLRPSEEEVVASNNNYNCFPVEAFPGAIQEIINNFQGASGLPVDYYGLNILTVASALIGNSFTLKYKTDYAVKPMIFGALVGRSSIGKTPILQQMLQPLYDLEINLHEKYQLEIEDWEAEKAKNPKSSPPKPKRKELMLNSATVEAIYQSLSVNPNGVILVQDELLGWLQGMDQYRKGGDMQFWLSIWSSSPVKVNRATKDTILIPKPFLSVIGSIQPGRLEQLATDEHKSNGFLARILFAYPENQQKPYESDFQLDPAIPERYKSILEELYELGNSYKTVDDTKIITLSAAAKTCYSKWKRENTDLINQADFEDLAAMYGKLEDYCLRIALILELLSFASTETSESFPPIEVQETTLQSAILLVEYFRKMGEKVLNLVDKIDPIANLSDVKQLVYRKLPTSFTTNQGLEIAGKYGMPARTFKRFLKERDLFKKVSHGHYQKC